MIKIPKCCVQNGPFLLQTRLMVSCHVCQTSGIASHVASTEDFCYSLTRCNYATQSLGFRYALFKRFLLVNTSHNGINPKEETFATLLRDVFIRLKVINVKYEFATESANALFIANVYVLDMPRLHHL